MDLTKPISYNGWTASQSLSKAAGSRLSGYLVKSVQVTDVDATQYMEKRAVHDGMSAADTYLNGRRIVMIVSVYGSTRGDAWDKLADLQEAFSPTIAYDADSANLGFLALDFYRPTADIATWPTSANPSGIPQRIYARPLFPPRYPLQRDGDGGTGVALDTRVEMIARDPRIYHQTQQSVSLSTSSQTATNRGNYPSWPIVTFSITATGSSALTVVTAGYSVAINFSSQSSGDFTLDYSNRTLEAGGTSYANLYTGTPVFKQIAAGGSVVYLVNATGLTATMTYREAWA